MWRVAMVGLLLFCVSGIACGAATKHKETTDPTEAAQDPDFGIQGEYLGEGKLPESGTEKVGAQVIARSNGEFEVVVYQGGLPGAGWKRGDKRFTMIGKRNGNTVTLTGSKPESQLQGTIANGELRIVDREGKVKVTLPRTMRRSPTLSEKAPAGAKVLFDGQRGINEFTKGVVTAEKNLQAEAVSVPLPPDYHLHLEFRLSWMPTARGQARSNSGVYLHDCYEIQVLDSFGLEGANNECGGIYSMNSPAVNMCLPPLTWQTYDVDFIAPKYNAAGEKTQNARVTVRHNGVAIYQDLELPKFTPGRQKEGPAPRPLYLQGHGNKVMYGNIWIVEKK